MVSAFAGRFAPRGGHRGEEWQPRLEAALRVDGPAVSAVAEPLTVAWTAADRSASRFLCLADGRLRVAGLAGQLGLDPDAPVERVLTTGYSRFGYRVVEWVGGDFALLLWDRDARRGLIARDRLGTRPLFTVESGGALLFATEIRNLLPLLPTRPAPDGVAVAHWLARTSSRSDRTLYEGIRRLPPGHALRLSAAGLEAARYWHPRYAPPRKITAGDAAAEVRAGIGRAVERALDGAQEPGIMLSGGFDSSTVAAAARSLGGDRVPNAYSVVFPADAAVDESARIARVRDWVGLPAVEASFLEASPLSAGLEFLTTWQVPSVTPNLFIWLPMLRRAAADGVDVMLDGEGGDELFGCAPYLVADKLRSGRPFSALRVARRLPGMGEKPRARWLRRALVKYGLRALLPHRLHEPLRGLRQGARLPDWLGEEAQRAQRVDDDPWAWKRETAPRWWAQLADALLAAVDAIGAPDQLRREAALAGLELRHPLRDPELLELVLGLPPELAFDPDIDRPLARLAMSGALPPEVLLDDRKPFFNSQLTSSMLSRDIGALRALLANPHPELARRIRATAVAEMLQGPSHAARPHAWSVDVWRLASLELWLEYQADAAVPDRLAEMLDPTPAVTFTKRSTVGS
jgi:asparagine synthase (glutamine-hydrolysing)